MPQISEFKSDSDNYTDVYNATISYIYANLIILKIKEPIIYNKIINCNYTVDEIIKAIKVIDLTDYEMRIGGWHTNPLQRFIEPIMETYLLLNLKRNTSNWDKKIYYSGEFIIQLTDEQRNPLGGLDNKIDLTLFFKDRDDNINSKLEFINNFELN